VRKNPGSDIDLERSPENTKRRKESNASPEKGSICKNRCGKRWVKCGTSDEGKYR
jgi:hypothetical protein